MKKRLPILLALCLAFVLCLALAACNNDKTQDKLESGNIVAEGDFVEGVTLATSKLEATDDNYKAAITKIADKDYDKEKVAVFDISLVKDNAKVQPSGKVKITMPAPFTTENGYTTYHIKGETVEELATTLSNGKISFETTSFSYFVVAGTTGGSVIGPGGLTPNDPTKNFFAYVDKFEQGALTANGTDVPKGGYSATLKEGDKVELIASANKGYEMLGWYKNEKASGSDEKYDEMSNLATFTYSGTEKMYVYARFDVITYEITVNLNGGELKSGEDIPETYNVETATITLPTPEKGTEEFLGWTDGNGETVTEIAQGSTGNIVLTAQWKAPAYVRVDKNKNPDENGEYVLFGSYPQTEVAKSISELRNALMEKAGDLPENGKNGKWTSFDYYYTERVDGEPVLSNEIDFMWYIDVEHNGEKYRGIYFTSFRPEYALGWNEGVLGRDPVISLQYKNHYFGKTVYWFKYEPILWKIIKTEGNKLQLLSTIVLDSQPYCTAAQKSQEKTYTNKEKNEGYYAYYNVTPGVPEGTVATDYTNSNIRSWLNNDFYGIAFGSAQKACINDTLLDNKTAGLGDNTTDKVFLITLDEAYALGSDDDACRIATPYAKCQGANVNPYTGDGSTWLLRELYYPKRFNPDAEALFGSYRFDCVCQVQQNGSRRFNYGKYTDPAACYVMRTMEGVVPSLWITL